MLVELGFLAPAAFAFPRLPAGAPDTAKSVWHEVEYLLRIRRLTDLSGTTFPLVATWLAEWSGGRVSEKETIAGRLWLDRHGYLCRSGQQQGRGGGKPMNLWRAVDPKSGAAL